MGGYVTTEEREFHIIWGQQWEEYESGIRQIFKTLQIAELGHIKSIGFLKTSWKVHLLLAMELSCAATKYAVTKGLRQLRNAIGSVVSKETGFNEEVIGAKSGEVGLDHEGIEI